MTIKLPVSSFSKKILLSQYSQPVKVNATSILYQQFSYPRYNFPTNIPLAKKLLNDELQFEISARLPKRNPNLFQIGLNLHKYHLELLMNFIYAQILINGQATEAIRLYYDLHDLEDEDYDTESAYRRWQRYYRKKRQKTSQIINNNGSKIRGCDYVKKIPLEEESVETLLSEFVFRNISFFITTDYTFRAKLLKQLKFYLLNKYSLTPVKNLAAEFNIHEQTIYTSMRSFRHFIQYNAEFSEKLNEITINKS